MTVDKITTIAGISGMATYMIDGAIQSGLITPDIAPMVKAGQGLALAVVAWYVGKPIAVRVR